MNGALQSAAQNVYFSSDLVAFPDSVSLIYQYPGCSVPVVDTILVWLALSPLEIPATASYYRTQQAKQSTYGLQLTYSTNGHKGLDNHMPYFASSMHTVLPYLSFAYCLQPHAPYARHTARRNNHLRTSIGCKGQ